MVRWHQSCSQPDVYVDGKELRCKACSNHFLVQDNFESHPSKLPPLPPNEPVGRLNLRWPPSVPYAKHENRCEGGSSHSVDSLPERIPERLNHCQTYGKTLAADQFRLICLSAPKDEERHDFPLHVSLETYDQDHCPEYETVSYTWGGEEGDSTPCKAIFVGKHWDVIFQTRNCWEMLRFIRPSRGVRMVWVDAICINQGNVEERGQQVAKMGEIYRKCSQVIVFLGPEYILSKQGHFPARRRIHELEGEEVHPELPKTCRLSRTRLPEILGRAYFSRIWVIQELVLAPNAKIRIGDVDFLVNPSLADDLKTQVPAAWQWDSTAAPWFQHATTGRFRAQDIFEVVRITSKSRASDNRDRIFGVLGLLENWAKHPPLLPDYSLSESHLFIGFFAYCLIILRQTQLLSKARGLSAPKYSPTWIPEWESDGPWQAIFAERLDDSLSALKHKMANLLPSLELFPLGSGEDLKSGIVFKKKPWHHNIAVDTNTGALSINLTRFCTVSSQPMYIGKQAGELGIFRVSWTNCTLFLVSRSDLETVTCPGKDHLFIFNPGELPLTYLILRKEETSKAYKLVASCQDLFLGIARDRANISKDKPTSLMNLQRSARDAIKNTRAMLKMEFASKAFRLVFAQVFPGIFPDKAGTLRLKKRRVVFSIYRNILENNEDLAGCYLSCLERLRPNPPPRMENGYLEITLLNQDWWAKNYGTVGEVRVDGRGYVDSDSRSISRPSWDLRGSCARIKIKSILKWLQDFTSPDIRVMRQLMRALNMGVGELQNLLETEDIGDKYDFTGCPRGFDMVGEDFDVDGSTFQVCIL